MSLLWHICKCVVILSLAFVCYLCLWLYSIYHKIVHKETFMMDDGIDYTYYDGTEE